MKTIRDPVHGDIELSEAELAVVDTEAASVASVSAGVAASRERRPQAVSTNMNDRSSSQPLEGDLRVSKGISDFGSQ